MTFNSQLPISNQGRRAEGATNRLLDGEWWIAISVAGAAAFGYVALERGETIGAAWLVVAAVCTYLVAYRFYSRFIAEKVFELDPQRATPAERLNNGRDFVPTNKWILFGHHFSAISGAGPLVGPTLAAQFGFLPGTIWLIVGVVLGGAVQDIPDPVRVDAPRRQVARPDGEGGSQPGRRHGGDGRDLRDHDHPARRAGAGRRQRAARQPVGPVHAVDDDSDRAAHGLVDERIRPGQGGRGDGDRHRAAARGADRRAVGRRKHPTWGPAFTWSGTSSRGR